MNFRLLKDQTGAAPVLILLGVIGVVAFLAIAGSAPFKNNLLSSLFPKEYSFAATALPGCWPTSGSGFAGTLAGQPNAIWCYTDYSDGPSTAVKGTNTWVDNFNHGLSFGRFDTTNYTDFPETGSLCKSQLFRHGNHWMRDIAGIDQNGEGVCAWDFGASSMRPNATFQAENGQLTIEADVATRVASYGGNLFWPEFVITTADRPTSIRTNGTYVYETFPSAWTLGCRLQNDGGFTCAMLDDGPGGDTPSRVFELSHFQCGNSEDSPHPGSIYGCQNIYGGLPSNLPSTDAAYSRDCANLDADTNCRDRWRWEITNNRLTWFVNGKKYMEHTGFQPAGKAAIDQLLTQPVYVYFGEFMYKLGKPARMHWDRIAINPKDGSGNIVAPSTAESFCFGQPLNTCGATPPPSASPAPSSAASPSIAPSSNPSASPAPSPSTSTVLTTLEAENGTITSPFIVSGGMVSQTVDTQSDPLTGGKAAYTFNAPVAGNYIVKATVTAIDPTSDSLFVNIDSEPTTGNIWDIPLTGAAGAERTVTWRPSTTAKTFNLSAGNHTLIIRGREPNVKIDKVKIEFLGSLPSPSPVPSGTKPGDIDGNNKVDIFDYNILLTNFGKTGSGLQGDFDNNGKVDIFDFNTLLSNFGK